MHNKYKILDVKFDSLSLKECIPLIEQFIREERFHYIATPDMHRVLGSLKDAQVKQIYAEADLTLSDGTAIVLASRISGSPLKERIACPDLIAGVFGLSADKGYRIFIVRGGGHADTEKAERNIIRAHRGVNIVGTYSVPYGSRLSRGSFVNQELLKEITEKKPHVLLFALGYPKEEKWIWQEKDSLKEIPVCIGIGGALEIYAGRIKRSPKWMQRTGTEWLFRIIQEPRKLWRRYAKGCIIFTCLLLKILLMRIRYAIRSRKSLHRIYSEWCFLNAIQAKDILKKGKINLIFKVKPYTFLFYTGLSRLYDLTCYLERSKIKGSLVECGVYNGGSAGAICWPARKDRNRQIWLFDSWEGLPEPAIHDGKDAEKGMCKGDKEKVSELLFKKLKLQTANIHLIKGWFEKTLPQHKKDIGRIALLHLGCDYFQSTQTCLCELYDSVTDGGFLIIDDYNNESWPGCRKAADEFIGQNASEIELVEIKLGCAYFRKIASR